MTRKNGGGLKPAGTPVMPIRFRCKVGLEWKPWDSFSLKQRKTIQLRFDAGNHIDAAHSGMVCLEHTSQVAMTLKCELCGLKKDRSQFSKQSLKNDDYKCVNCVAWTETQEPDVTPAPLLTGHVSVEEEGREVWRAKAKENIDLFGDDALPQAPITGLSGLGVGDDVQRILPPSLDVHALIQEAITASTSAYDSSSDSRETNNSQLPPHLRSFSDTTSMVSDMDSLDIQSVSSTCQIGRQSRDTSTLPPHLRGRDTSDASSVSGTSVTSSENVRPSAASRSMLTATTMRLAKMETHPAMGYNAWDSSGMQHSRVKSPSIASSTTGSMSLIDYGEDDGAYNNTIERVNAFQPVRPKRGGKNQWHKAPRLTTQELLAFENRESNARSIDTKIDRQRRYNYTDSDDHYD